MKRWLLISLMALAGSAAFAKDNLAILPFTGGTGEEGETIAELFSFEKDLTAVFDPVPRTSINRAIRSEQRFQMESGMTDPDTIASLGRQLGAQYIVSGSITTLGNQKLLVIAILKIDELRQIAGDVQTYRDIEEIQDKLPGMARNIAAAVRTGGSTLPRLAVVPVELAGGADKRDADTLAQILAVNFIRAGKYGVYPRTASLEQIQGEYATQLSGDTADEHLPDVGQGTNPDLVLSVTARKLGNRNMFNAAIINLVTGMQAAGESANYQSLDEGIQVMERLAFALGGEKRDWTVSDAAAFVAVIALINGDARGGPYTVILEGSFASGPVSFTGNAARTVTLRGDNSLRTITNNGGGALFTVPKGTGLVLDNNLTLEGNKKGEWLVLVIGGSLSMKAGSTVKNSQRGGVYVGSDGSFVMSGGTITGNSAGGGVAVSGSFTMNGGTISGNSANWGGGVLVDFGGSFTMSGGTVSGNRAERNGDHGGNGGGVMAGSRGSFTMSGGTITGNSAARWGGGVYVWDNEGGSFAKDGGTIDAANSAKNGGRAVYVFVDDGGSRKRDAAAGPGVNLDSRIAGLVGGWE
jgi:TolB-like protein